MLYPYHLSDVIVKGLRITPFQFYISTIIHVMESDKSYDSIPNFTAVDCNYKSDKLFPLKLSNNFFIYTSILIFKLLFLGLRILGIGRNEYIELMNQCRTKNKLFRRKHEIRPMLPSQPINMNVDPWWVVDVGCLYEDDIKVYKNSKTTFY